MIKICPVCDRSFETARGSRIYCSDACKFADSTEDDGMGTMTTCPVCKKTFRRKVRRQIYCGRSCAAKGKAKIYRQNKMPKAPEPERYCEIYGKSLKGIKNARRYCDDPGCKREGNRRQRLENKEKQDLICKCCGKEFQRTSFVLYCSKDCQMKDARRRINEAQEERRKGTPVKIKVTKVLDVYENLRPTVGQVYDGYVFRDGRYGETMIIPSIGKYGLIIRKSEAEIIG